MNEAEGEGEGQQKEGAKQTTGIIARLAAGAHLVRISCERHDNDLIYHLQYFCKCKM
jgi:hypothetical protein